MSGTIRARRPSPCCSCSRFLHPWDADWIPVLARVGRRCWSATEKTQLKMWRRIFLWCIELVSIVTARVERRLDRHDGGKRLREHLAGFFSAQTEERFCALKLTSAAGNLSSVDEMHTFDVWCANDYINTKQRGAVELKCCAETRTFQVILPSAQLIWCGCWVCWCVFVIVKTLITMVCCLHSFLSFNISDVETSSLSVAFGFFCKTRRQIWIKKECCFQVLNWTNHKYWQPTNDHY